MVGIIVGLMLYFICNSIQKHYEEKIERDRYCDECFRDAMKTLGIPILGDEEKSKPKYRMKEVDEEVIFFTNSTDFDEAFKL